MPPPRSIIATLVVACASVPNGPPAIGADSAAVWTPYRELAIPRTPVAEVPAQYVLATPPADVPFDVISDADLDRLNAACCANPFGIPYVETTDAGAIPFGDPVLAPTGNTEVWTLQLLPNDLLWHSYWAGAKEPRISATPFEETNGNVTLLDVTLGGRSSMLRYGNYVDGRPQGWELQVEGAAMLRLNLDENWDLEAADFRFGVPLIFARNKLQWKLAYYHLSSHLGDEFIIRTGSAAPRINYARDELVLGAAYFPLPAWRWYSEAGWAFYADEGADPWEFQFGLDYAQPGPTGRCGTPFVALNGHLREEVDFGGNFVVQAGWLWRGQGGRVLRTGLHYYNGKSNQFEFVNNFEQQIGAGLWHEF